MMYKIPNRKKIAITVCKVICVALCTFLFVLLMKSVMDKYYEQTTTTGIRFRNEESRQLPCVTFCPVEVFKKRGFYYEEKSYLENTFRLEDIFHDYTLQIIKNKTNFLTKEIHTFYFGTCFTLCCLTYFEAKASVFIKFRYLSDIKLFVHGPGEEFWLLASFTFPSEVGNVNLNIQEESNIVVAAVAIKETDTVYLNQEHSPCVPEVKKESVIQSYNRFLECSKEKVWQNISELVSCSVFGFDAFYNNSQLPMCDKEDTAAKTFDALYFGMLNFVSNPAKFGCPLPCRRTSYSLNTVYIHKNSLFKPKNMSVTISNEFALVYSFESLQVEERIETLVKYYFN